ncbi:MAG: segregation/condensation protein A [Clostridia bacterium]|nr:segregation/condensation protein A [Clostridia bacterium]
MTNVLKLETNKYAIKIDNFEGPLDLLCYLIDKNKMDISEIKISEIADQYLEYIKASEEMELEVASEFLVMASTLLLIKSKKLLPSVVEDEAELTEEELLQRIIEYKKYKQISENFKEWFAENNKRFYKQPDKIELKDKKFEKTYESNVITEAYANLLRVNREKVNVNAKNIEKIAISETVTVASKVKDIFRELVKHSKFVFSKLFSLNKCSKMEVITAFSGVLELTRRNKVIANQDSLFGDIVIEKAKKQV